MRLASGQLVFIDADDAGQVRISIYASPPKLDDDGVEMPDAFLLLSPEEATEIAGTITDAAGDRRDTGLALPEHNHRDQLPVWRARSPRLGGET